MSDEAVKLLEKRERINARLRQLKGKEKRGAKKLEDRKKILAGAYLLEQAKRDAAVQGWMLRGLAWFLVRADERALFGLTAPPVTGKDEGSAVPGDTPVAEPAAAWNPGSQFDRLDTSGKAGH